MYDVIVVGARVAGSPLAMLLARQGLKVLLLDRASFPSDTLSTHQVQLKGVSALQRWGLLQKVMDTGCPPVDRLAFHQGRFHIHGKYFPLDGLGYILCPRRTVLDKTLVDAAVESGAELRQDLIVEDLLVDSGRVTGIRGRMKSGDTPVAETARLVVGADGKHSLVARLTQAAEYHTSSPSTCAYYTYWEGVPVEAGELYNLPQAVVGMWPTNAGQVILYTGYPIGDFNAIRANVEGRFWKTVEEVPGLDGRLRAGRQSDRFYGTADLPCFFRRPSGPGWALVGDSGVAMDPITGQGIGNAFADAGRLAEAIQQGFSGRQPIEQAMAAYENERNKDSGPMANFTRQVAAFEPPPLQQELLFAALEKKPAQADRFFGMLTGSVPVKEFFSPGSLLRILGMRGMVRAAMGNKKALADARALVSSNLETG